jgi:hypothetical protein
MQFIRFLAQYLNNFPSHFLYTWDGSPTTSWRFWSIRQTNSVGDRHDFS